MFTGRGKEIINYIFFYATVDVNSSCGSFLLLLLSARVGGYRNIVLTFFHSPSRSLPTTMSGIQQQEAFFFVFCQDTS